MISSKLVVPFISCDLNYILDTTRFLMQSNVQVALERENDNLKREYSMMTMAWYDLSSRVQSNTVMLQRRSEVSKSWINKQRRAVNPTGRR
jgi:protein HOOK3